MRILMVAPEPVFTPRGTPFSVAFRTRALTELGHQVDLATYPFGMDLRFEGLRILRSASFPGVRAVKVGPSLAKLPLDAALFGLAGRLLQGRSYDLLHTHEEAGFWGTFVSGVSGIPHLYDMHSSLPQQLENFRFGNVRPVVAVFEALEKITLRRSAGVIAICQDLYDRVRAIAPGVPVALIENVLDPALIDPDVDRQIPSLGRNGRFVVLYAGTFEPYQGVDLMLEAVQRARETVPDLRFVLAGGNPQQIEAAKERARSLGISQNVEFRGPQSPRTISRWMREADVLLTARTSGTNTPLKIYSYLSSGTPILATDIYSHRQVLNDDVSVLVKPEPEAVADGLIRLWRDTGLRKRLSLNALAYFRENYSYERYVEAVDRIVQQALEHARQGRTGGSNA